MSFRNPLTGPVTVAGTIAVQTPSTPGLVLNQAQALNKTGTSGLVTFAGVVGGATITTVTLTPTVGKTLYVVSFDWSIRSAAGAVAFTAPAVTLSGGAALTFQFPNIAGSTTGIGSFTFPQPLTATGAVAFALSYAAASGSSAGQVGVLNVNGFEL